LLSAGEPVWFLTVCAHRRDGISLLPAAAAILEAACHRHRLRLWALRLCLVMPDHVHLLATLPPEASLARTVGDWKRLLAVRHGIAWQRNFYDHRIRSETSASEKWDYIRLNPVRKGLCTSPEDWPWWTGFHPATGERFPGAWG
jgi:REP element-mobilizing transposase RayT